MIDENKKRLFIALNLPKEIKDLLNKVIISLSSLYKGVKWVNPENLHLTLHFLGFLTLAEQDEVKKRICELSGKIKKIELILDKINAFPNLNNPRVIYINCKQINGDSIFLLHKLLADKLAEAGIKTDNRPWKTHITLGRIKYEKIIFNNKINLNLYNKYNINSFELMESVLKPSGPVYKVVESYEL